MVTAQAQKVENVTEPQRRSLLARQTYDVYSDEKSKITSFDIPLPWLGFNTDNRFQTPYLMVSGDGERWEHAQFPHISNGWVSGCMQSGRFSVDRDDVAANLSSYVIAYISIGIHRYWRELFEVPGIEKMHEEFLRQEANRFGSPNRPFLHPAPFMSLWEQKSIEDVCGYINQKVGGDA